MFRKYSIFLLLVTLFAFLSSSGCSGEQVSGENDGSDGAQEDGTIGDGSDDLDGGGAENGDDGGAENGDDGGAENGDDGGAENGDDGGDENGDAGGDMSSTGACQNELDQAIINNPEIDVAAVASNCTMQCMAEPDVVACITACISTATDLSEECSRCYAELSACGVDNCLTFCISDPSGEACVSCIQDNCMADMEACTG